MLAERLAEASCGTVDAVVFYGSHLHGATPDRHSALDFIVVVGDYAAFYRALRSAGALHRHAWILSALARILPPNSIAFAQNDASGPMAKCLIVSHADLEQALGPRRRDHFLLGRLVQRVTIVWARDATATAWIERRIAQARTDVLDWIGPFLEEPFDAESAGRRMIEVSYGAELRPEASDRASLIFETQRDHFRTTLTPVLQHHAASGRLIRVGARYYLAAAPSRGQYLAWRWYFIWSNVRITARWLKHVVTFDEWLPYLTKKVERRTGQTVKLSTLERRWPLIFLWPRVIRTLRMRPAREARKDVQPGDMKTAPHSDA